MDFRSKKVFDFVAVEKNMKEAARKNEIVRLQWFQRFEWMLDDYKTMQRELLNLCDEKKVISETQISEDKRSCLPFPETTSGMYGWLASKPEFRLENPKNYIVKYPNPMDEITLLKGDIPRIAPGMAFL
ncbi:uncharacterized protein LOC117169069 [Belonocnema kinseyi]|uniref:uncharacterized protein LOC117169069 n=1 Tax=Belonocnema kinseyi TaxID=2817044 RepID=UPI00143DEB9F|nr:uncharacterized protein LOC117169069 [Belonocnema kinseyi]XP_033211083.1 uncharacterized protein LOC117169069 [Belonocnema kinseyi]